MRNSLFLFLFIFSFQALAGEATFGPEFNFTNDHLVAVGREMGGSVVDSPANLAAQKNLVAEVQRRCPECTVTPGRDKFGLDAYTVKTREGWSFTITLDPWVVEVIADGMTAKQIAERAPQIQNLIFDAAAAVHLYPQPRSGHIHIGINSAFKRDPLLLRNFIVDWANHASVMFQAFYGNLNNSAPMDQIRVSDKETVQDLFEKFVTAWDSEYHNYRRHLWLERSEALLRKFVKGMVDSVYVKTYADWSPAEKYQNINMSHILKFPQNEQTVELRSVREFQDARHYAEFAQVLQGRIDYLETFNRMLPVVRAGDSGKPAYQVFDEYIYKSNGNLVYNRLKTSFGSAQFPLRISCETLF